MMRGIREKYILKKAFRAELPPEIFSRVKRPYGAPNKEAFFTSGSLRPEVRPYLERDAVHAGGVFDADRVDALIAKCSRTERSGFRDSSALLGVLSTQILLRQFC
jgi:asparagine synthase (glutamine-hydrolysing)